MALPWNMNVNGHVKPPVDCETGTKYSAILFVNLGEYIYLNLTNNICQAFYVNALALARFLVRC